MTARRTVAAHPALAADAREAARAAAAEKAQRAPKTLTDQEVCLLPGKTVLELGNAGHLQHLGIGLPVKRAAPARKAKTTAATPHLTDADLAKMTGPQISKAMAAGRVAGVGARRTGRRH